MAEKQFLLPDLGEGLEDAELVSWRVAEGDEVELNQPLAEVETAKAVVEIPSPFAGRVAKLHASEGEVVKVGAPLVTFDVEGPGGRPADEAPTEEAPKREAVVGEDRPKRQAVLVGYGPPPEEEPRGGAAVAATAATAQKVRATPPVRKLAKELGIELGTLRGSGPGGRVSREDVERAASGGAVAARAAGDGLRLREERIPVRGVRRAVAEKMTRSAFEIPHVTTFLTADFSWVMALRDEVRAESPDARATPLAIVGRALAEIVRDHRKLNASWDGDANEIVLRGTYHLGIATDTERGLMVPVVRDADRLRIRDLAAAIGEVVSAARSGKATPDQLTGSTITISNVGTFGAEYGTPIINHPEASILALGVIEPRALVDDGEVAVKPACTLSLSFDHRVMDGAEAGYALKALRDLLQSPFRLGALPQ